MRKKLHQYSDDELKKLYSRKDLYEMTQSILENSENNILKIFLDNSKQTIKQTISRNENIKSHLIQNVNINNDKEKNDWINNIIEINNTCKNILEWTAIYYYDDSEDDNNNKLIYESIHKNDYNDIKNGKATKEEMYLFIWNTLRFTSIKKLQTLVDTYKDLYTANRPGVKSSNKKISVYDEKDNLITSYKNRNECMESENISKQNLYKYLKDGKLHKGKRFVESD